MKFRITFDNSDPQHARVNPLRARRDKPHIWFEEGYWRVCPRPIHRRQPPEFKDANWRKAQMFVFVKNGRLARDALLRSHVLEEYSRRGLGQ